ncbi:MAG: hypothetical protein ACYC1U_02100 [Candidatus Aquicultorales bacterium]
MKAFGAAEDFYRVRLVTIEEYIPPELDWDEDILYKQPPAFKIKSSKSIRVELIEETSGDIVLIKEFKVRPGAERLFRAAARDLKELTKHEFDSKYDISFRDTTVTSTN